MKLFVRCMDMYADCLAERCSRCGRQATGAGKAGKTGMPHIPIGKDLEQYI